MSFIKEFFFLNFSQYENIGIYFPIGVFLSLLCVSSIAFVFYVTYYKKMAGGLARQLLRHEAIGEQSAKTLRELRIAPSFFLKNALSGGAGQLTYAVKRLGEVKPEYEEFIKNKKRERERIDFDTAAFYIDAERVEVAKKLVANSDQSWLVSALIALAIVGITVVLAVFLPDILEIINSSI